MLNLIRTFYSSVVFYGLIAVIWFAAAFQGARDIWSASVLFGAITFLSLLFIIGRTCDKRPVYFPLALSLSIFLVCLAFSVQRSYDMETSWLEFWGWAFTFLAFYLFVNTFQTERDLERFFFLSGFVLIPLLAQCIWQRVDPPIPTNGQPPTVGVFGYGLFILPLSWIRPGLAWTFRYGHWEIHASLVNSVVLAGFALYWTLFYLRKARERPVYAFLFITNLIILGFSRSWWAFLSLGIGVIFYYRNVLLMWMGKYKAVSMVLTLLTIAGIAFMFYFKTHRQVERAQDNRYYHASARWDYWQAAVHMAKQAPLTGIGPGAYAVAYPYFRKSSNESSLFAHGVFFTFFSETGILGLLALCLCLIEYISLRLKRRLTPLSDSPPYSATLGILLCFSLLSINMEFLINRLMFILLLGASLWAHPKQAFALRPLYAAGACCGLIFSGAFWLPLFFSSRLYIAGVNAEKAGNLTDAVRHYQSAVEIADYHADSYWRLSEIYKQKYRTTRAIEDLNAAKYYSHQAIRFKKDVRFLGVKTPTRQNAS